MSQLIAATSKTFDPAKLFRAVPARAIRFGPHMPDGPLAKSPLQIPNRNLGLTLFPLPLSQLMRPILYFSLLALSAGCSDVNREAVTFRCKAIETRNADVGREVTFHYDDGYLFLQNAQGGADNVCSQFGTIACQVAMTDQALLLRQTVDRPSCSWRSAINTSLDINRETSVFRFVQENCDPSGDMVIKGTCRFWSPP